jgi:hypothetical protein
MGGTAAARASKVGMLDCEMGGWLWNRQKMW